MPNLKADKYIQYLTLHKFCQAGLESDPMFAGAVNGSVLDTKWNIHNENNFPLEPCDWRWTFPFFMPVHNGFFNFHHPNRERWTCELRISPEKCESTNVIVAKGLPLDAFLIPSGDERNAAYRANMLIKVIGKVRDEGRLKDERYDKNYLNLDPVSGWIKVYNVSPAWLAQTLMLKIKNYALLSALLKEGYLND